MCSFPVGISKLMLAQRVVHDRVGGLERLVDLSWKQLQGVVRNGERK
jgi:hypothetical protein